MAAQEKQMGKTDLENFLKGQFPKSNEVNNLLEQIVASKNQMEKSLGEEIPSFYSTMSRLITVNTRNGISDWVNSNGQVNITRINKAAEIVKKEFEVRKRQEQEAEQVKQKQDKILNEFEENDKEDIKAKLSQIDFNNITQNDYVYIAEHISECWKDLKPEEQKKVADLTNKLSGATEIYNILDQILINPSLQEEPSIKDKIKDSPIAKKFFDEQGRFKQAEYELVFNEKVRLMGGLVKLSLDGNLTRESAKKFLEASEIYSKNPEIINIDYVMELDRTGELKSTFEEMKKSAAERPPEDNDELLQDTDEEKITEDGKDSLKKAEQSWQGIRSEKSDNIIDVVTGAGVIENTEITQDDMEDFFNGLFEGAIDLAEQAEEMGLPMQEGDGYTTFFDIEEGQQEHGQAGIDGQDIGEVDEMTGKQTVPNAMGVVGMFQAAAREDMAIQGQNDMQEEAYQSPMLDNLEDDKKGGILGFFSKLKEAVQARFSKKPEQKRLNPSTEQRTDENGWNITTYDGNGKDLVPRGKGLRNAMVRFAENTVGRLGKLVTNTPRSDEPINTPYVIPTNVQKKEDKQQTQDKTNQWAVDPSRLAPLEHNTKEVDGKVQGDSER